jgi:hypothetical protein
MSSALPARPRLEWLRKTARQQLKERRVQQPATKLADVQLALAREYGFPSWRKLKAHIDALERNRSRGGDAVDDSAVAAFLSAVGSGNTAAVRAALEVTPQLVNAVGPHPYWGGRPQALHVSIETARPNMFELLLAAGADVDGSNESYEQWSPLMLTFHWKQPQMRETLLARGAKVGLAEALLLGDDARVASMLRGTRTDLAKLRPNGGSILAMARTPFAIDLLLEHGAPRELKDRWDTSPLEAMSRLGPEGRPLFRHLLAEGLGASARDHARMGDVESLAELFETEPESVRAHEVLAEAAGFGHYELVEWLLARGAHVDSSKAGSWTALHSAAWEGHLSIVKLLVAAGADVTARDSGHNSTAAGAARAAIEATNNAACKDVADFLDSEQRGE